MAFGEDLRLMLEQKGITPAELSRRTGISKTTLSSMFSRDVNKIDIDIFLKICDAVDCDPTEFYHDYKRKVRLLLPAPNRKPYNCAIPRGYGVFFCFLLFR